MSLRQDVSRPCLGRTGSILNIVSQNTEKVSLLALCSQLESAKAHLCIKAVLVRNTQSGSTTETM